MSNVIKLKGVRLSFPSLYEKASFNGEEGKKYEATFLIPKSDTAFRKAIDAEMARLAKEEGVKIPPPDKLCIRDGDDSDYDGYADHWSLKASCTGRPTTIDRSKNAVAESDEVFYAGCYVNASVDLWFQNNQFGKRINANLRGVQFVRDGEEFGRGRTDATDEFDDISDEQVEGADDL